MKGIEVWKEANTRDTVEFLEYLYSRWQDEKEYEDWSEYVTAIKKKFSNFDIIKTSKRPFGFSVKCDTMILSITLKVTRNSVQLIPTQQKLVVA